MTLWARKSGFQDYVDDYSDVELIEKKDSVVFEVDITDMMPIDLETNVTSDWKYLKKYATGVGQDSAELVQKDNRVLLSVEVPRGNLPEDYNEGLD